MVLVFAVLLLVWVLLLRLGACCFRVVLVVFAGWV